MEYTRNPTPDIRRFYNTILSLRRFNALFHHPLVLQVVESLLAQPIFVHLRVICHLIFPGRPNHTADPHHDFAPVRGSQHTKTAWIPLGHCGDHLGGVAVALESHYHGLLDRHLLAQRPTARSANGLELEPLQLW